MRFFSVLGAALALISRAEDEDGYVKVLTSENFNAHIEAHPLTLVKFYAPWCGHCKRLAPEYEAAAQQLKDEPSMSLAKVDATEENSLATKFNIRGFPTMILFRDGQEEEYTGGRTADSIVQWMRRMSKPAVTPAANLAEARKAITEGDGFGLIAVVTSEESDAATVFKTVADGNRVAGSFIRVVDASAASETVRAVRPAEKFESEAVEITTVDAVEALLKSERMPFFGPVSGENFRDYVASGQDLVWFAGTEAHYNDAADDIRAAAQKLRGKALFLWLDTDKFSDHAARALAVKDYPALVYQNSTDSSRYVYPAGDKFPSSKVIKFVEDVQLGKIEKSLMSEPIPETNDEPVKVVVGKNFEEIVMDPTKDVLLEVYAPWCGHCKKFEPAYAEFATKVAANKHLVVAKMDGTANESPVADFEWRGFPTVFWVSATDKKPVQFDGPRTVEGLMEWVKEHSSQPIVVDDDSDEEHNGKDEL